MERTIGSILLDCDCPTRGAIVWRAKGNNSVGRVIVLTPDGAEDPYEGKLLSHDEACEWVGASYGDISWELEWADTIDDVPSESVDS